MVALPGGALAALGFLSVLLGLLYVSGLLAVTGSPGSTLLRRGLLWGGPAALVASVVGGYVAAWLAGGSARAAMMTGLVSVALALAITVTLVDIYAGDAIDFQSALVALVVENPARTPVEAIPDPVKDSMTSRSQCGGHAGRLAGSGFLLSRRSPLAAGAAGGWASASHQHRQPGEIGQDA